MFSKVLVIATSMLTLMVTIFVCVMVAVTGDLTVLESLIIALYAQMSAIAAFYFNKAKRENEIKLGSLYENDFFAKDIPSNEKDFSIMGDVEEGRG